MLSRPMASRPSFSLKNLHQCMSTVAGTRITGLWANPRTASTALMYSFAQRIDTRVVDEPLYPHWLRNNPQRQRPYRDELLSQCPEHGDQVMRALFHGASETSTPHLFLKQIAKFLDKDLPLDRTFLGQSRNIILIRHPRELIISFLAAGISPSLSETGLVQQVELLEEYGSSQDIPVIHNNDLVNNPEYTLRALCKRLGLRFTPDMLSWAPGGRVEDGLWGRHWYHGIHKSTGFQQDIQQSKRKALPSAREDLLQECLPYYQRLASEAMEVPTSLSSDSSDPPLSYPPPFKFGHQLG